VLMGASIIASALLLHRRMAHRSAYSIKRESVGEVLRGMRRAYANPAFLWLVAAGLAAYIAQGVAFALTNYLLDYVWRFSTAAKLIYAVALFVGVAGAFVTVAPLGRRYNKRDLAAVAGVVAAMVGTAPYMLRLAGTFDGASASLTLGVFLVAIAVSTMFGVISIMLIPSMMGDVVEADQIRSGRREEGLFGAGFMFMQKAATGVGIFVSGLMLGFARFPAKGVPGQVDAAVLDRLSMAVIIVAIALSLIAALAFRRFPFGRTEHDARLAELGEVPG
jgi:glycoside/pentoside/hexuronide:cation symporter, GPH family